MVLSQKDVICASDLPFARASGTFREASISSLLPERASVRSAAEEPRPASEPRPVVDPTRAMFAELAELPYAEAKRRLVSLFDSTYTGEILRRTSGNMSEAARRAGLDRSNFRRLLRRHKDEE
jgi:DNA-binding NtrC family response regulator